MAGAEADSGGAAPPTEPAGAADAPGRSDTRPSGTGGGGEPPIPTDPALDPAYRRFEEGNFREARRIAAELSRSETPAVREAALALVERLRPDPAALWIVAGCSLLFIIVIWLTLF